MNRGARLQTPVRTYLLTKAMQRRWHDLKQRHREPRVSHTGRQAFVNDSVGKRRRVVHSRDSPLWVVHACNSTLVQIPPGHLSAYTIISSGEPMTIVALLDGDIFLRLLHLSSPHTIHVLSSSAFCVQDVHSLYPASDSRMPSNA